MRMYGGASDSLVLVLLLVPVVGLMLGLVLVLLVTAMIMTKTPTHVTTADTAAIQKHKTTVQHFRVFNACFQDHCKSQFSKSILQSSSDHSQSVDSVSVTWDW